MTCREFTAFVADYLDGGWPDEQRSDFDRHLAICPACVAYLENYRTVMALGKGAFADPEAPVPPEVRAIKAARRQQD